MNWEEAKALHKVAQTWINDKIATGPSVIQTEMKRHEWLKGFRAVCSIKSVWSDSKIAYQVNLSMSVSNQTQSPIVTTSKKVNISDFHSLETDEAKHAAVEMTIQEFWDYLKSLVPLDP